VERPDPLAHIRERMEELSPQQRVEVGEPNVDGMTDEQLLERARQLSCGASGACARRRFNDPALALVRSPQPNI
jgi:hypothetical protein